MGFWSFAAHRIVDLFVPGAGLLLDLADAYELIEDLKNTGELSASAAEDLAGTVQSMHENGQEIRSAVIIRKVRRCGICRQAGHNRRTCPQG